MLSDDKTPMPAKVFNGPALLVAMFRELKPPFRQELFAKLQEASPILARLLDHTEFLYHDLLRLDDKSLQKVIRVTREQDLLIAWKLTHDVLKERLIANMSAAKKADFLEQFAKMRRMHKGQVYRVQATIAKQAYELLQQGQLAWQPRQRAKPTRQAS